MPKGQVNAQGAGYHPAEQVLCRGFSPYEQASYWLLLLVSRPEHGF